MRPPQRLDEVVGIAAQSLQVEIAEILKTDGNGVQSVSI